MVLKRIFTTGILGFVLVTGIIMANPAPASAAVALKEITCPTGQVHPKEWNGDIDLASCCPGTGNPSAMECFVRKYINPLVNLLAVGIGVVVVGSVTAGGIQYSSAQGDPGKVAAAKERIFNALLALSGFIFLYAFLQWVIPGGL
jgi:hypothetical protein